MLNQVNLFMCESISKFLELSPTSVLPGNGYEFVGRNEFYILSVSSF